MKPLQELLSKIRWDKEFGKGRFEIGYDDHLQKRIVRISFEEILNGQHEFAPDLEVLVAREGASDYQVHYLPDLLPHSFDAIP